MTSWIVSGMLRGVDGVPIAWGNRLSVCTRCCWDLPRNAHRFRSYQEAEQKAIELALREPCSDCPVELVGVEGVE